MNAFMVWHPNLLTTGIFNKAELWEYMRTPRTRMDHSAPIFTMRRTRAGVKEIFTESTRTDDWRIFEFTMERVP